MTVPLLILGDRGFDEAWPTLSFQSFVKQAGCSDAEVPFECLQSVDTIVLQNASANVSASADFGQWVSSSWSNYILAFTSF